MIKLFRNTDLISPAEGKDLLNEFLSPKLEEFGLQYDGDYLWYSGFENAARKVLRYQPLKGRSGILYWGFCFDFVPMISGRSLHWNRSEKTVKLHLFDNPRGNPKSKTVSHWGRKNFTTSLAKHFQENKEAIDYCFHQHHSIEDFIRLAEYQFNKREEYAMHYPNPRYVLIFLYSKQGLKEKAREVLHQMKLEEEIRTKIEKLI